MDDSTLSDSDIDSSLDSNSRIAFAARSLADNGTLRSVSPHERDRLLASTASDYGPLSAELGNATASRHQHGKKYHSTSTVRGAGTGGLGAGGGDGLAALGSIQQDSNARQPLSRTPTSNNEQRELRQRALSAKETVAGGRIIRESNTTLFWGMRLLGLVPSKSPVARVYLGFVLVLYAVALCSQPIYFMFASSKYVDAANIAFDLLASVQDVFAVACATYFCFSGRLSRLAARAVTLFGDDTTLLRVLMRKGRWIVISWLLCFVITYAIDIANFLDASLAAFFVRSSWAKVFAIAVWLIPDALYTMCTVGVFPLTCALHEAMLCRLISSCRAILPEDGGEHLPISASDLRGIADRVLKARKMHAETASFWSWAIGVQFVLCITTASTSIMDYGAGRATGATPSQSSLLYLGLFWFVVVSIYPALVSGALVSERGKEFQSESVALFGRIMTSSRRNDDQETLSAARDLLLLSQSDACKLGIRVGGVDFTVGLWFSITVVGMAIVAGAVRIHDQAVDGSSY